MQVTNFVELYMFSKCSLIIFIIKIFIFVFIFRRLIVISIIYCQILGRLVEKNVSLFEEFFLKIFLIWFSLIIYRTTTSCWFTALASSLGSSSKPSKNWSMQNILTDFLAGLASKTVSLSSNPRAQTLNYILSSLPTSWVQTLQCICLQLPSSIEFEN